MKANIELAEGKRDDAQKLLEQAIAAHPDSMAARSALAIAGGELGQARRGQGATRQDEGARVRATFARSTPTRWLPRWKATTSRARDAIQKVLAVRPDDLPSLMLSGLIDFQLRLVRVGRGVACERCSRGSPTIRRPAACSRIVLLAHRPRTAGAGCAGAGAASQSRQPGSAARCRRSLPRVRQCRACRRVVRACQRDRQDQCRRARCDSRRSALPPATRARAFNDLETLAATRYDEDRRRISR